MKRLQAHLSVEVRARCVHVEPRAVDARPPQFLAGFEVLTSFKTELGALVESLERSARGLDAPRAPEAAATGAGASRRSGPRFEVSGTIEVAIGEPPMVVRLRDIGLGGFAVES